MDRTVVARYRPIAEQTDVIVDGAADREGRATDREPWAGAAFVICEDEGQGFGRPAHNQFLGATR